MGAMLIFRDCWAYKEKICDNFEELNASLKKNILEFENNREDIGTIKVAPHLKNHLDEGPARLNYFEQEPNDTTIIENLIKDHVRNAVLNVFDNIYPEVYSDMTELKNVCDNLNTRISDSWYHITSYGGYHDYHTHDGSALSGIYYVSAGEADRRQGFNRFYKPWSVGDHNLYGPLGAMMVDNIDSIPKDGDILIFPAFLPHSAITYLGKQRRIVLGFNINFIPEKEWFFDKK